MSPQEQALIRKNAQLKKQGIIANAGGVQLKAAAAVVDVRDMTLGAGDSSAKGGWPSIRNAEWRDGSGQTFPVFSVCKAQDMALS